MNFSSDFIIVGLSLILGLLLLPGGIIHICSRGDRKITLGVICVVLGFVSLAAPHILFLLSYFGVLTVFA